MALSPSEARVVDAVLTNHARGYVHPERIAQHLFPAIPVNQRGGRRIEFNKDGFRRMNTRRAPGAKRQEIEFGFLGAKFALEQRDLVGKVPEEIAQEAQRGPGIDMGRQAVEQVQDIISLDKEAEAANLALDPNNYDAAHKVALAGSNQWSHADSDPKADIKTGREAIRSAIGMEPNTLVLGPRPYRALDDHPKILEKFKYTSSESITTAMLARYFDIPNVHVGRAVYANDAGEFVDVWGTSALLAYVPTDGARRMNAPSYGYTYQLAGHPFVGQNWWDNDTKSRKYPVTDEYSAELVGADAGYLIQGASA